MDSIGLGVQSAATGKSMWLHKLCILTDVWHCQVRIEYFPSSKAMVLMSETVEAPRHKPELDKNLNLDDELKKLQTSHLSYSDI